MTDGGATEDTAVVDVPEEKRYEIRLAGRPVGFSAYIRGERLIVFTHTEIEPGHEGEGLGSTLVRSALDDARRLSLAVVPMCPFVRSYLERHPEYADLEYRQPPSTAAD